MTDSARIEAAARAIYNEDKDFGPEWTQANEGVKSWYRAAARVALAAADEVRPQRINDEKRKQIRRNAEAVIESSYGYVTLDARTVLGLLDDSASAPGGEPEAARLALNLADTVRALLGECGDEFTLSPTLEILRVLRADLIAFDARLAARLPTSEETNG